MNDFPLTAALSRRHADALPAEADVVVIGGGIAGVSAAWELAGKGLKVVLCDKGRVGAEQSGRNWGWIRVQGRDPSEIPLVLEARRIWESWAQRLGPDLGYKVVGVTYLARTEAELAEDEAWLKHARAHDLDTRMLSRAETAERMVNAAPDRWIGAMQTASDAKAEPWVAVPMMARSLAGAGVTIRESCAVRSLIVEAGRVRGVVTEDGPIRADAVVLAGGAWSSLFLRAHGVDIPQLSVLASACATVPLPAGFDGAASDPQFALRRRADGGYTVAPGDTHVMYVGPDAFRHLRADLTVLKSDWRSTKLRPSAPAGFPDAWSTRRRWSPDEATPFEAMRILDPKPDRKALDGALTAFGKAYPTIGKPAIRAWWGGMIDTMPDVVPVLDTIDSLPGLTVGCGLSGHGFGIGPAIGRVLADLATGGDPGHDLSRFRVSRFRDGSRVTPGPAL